MGWRSGKIHVALGERLVVRCVYSVPIIFGVPMNLAPAAASMQVCLRESRPVGGRAIPSMECPKRVSHESQINFFCHGGEGCNNLAVSQFISFFYNFFSRIFLGNLGIWSSFKWALARPWLEPSNQS